MFASKIIRSAVYHAELSKGGGRYTTSFRSQLLGCRLPCKFSRLGKYYFGSEIVQGCSNLHSYRAMCFQVGCLLNICYKVHVIFDDLRHIHTSLGEHNHTQSLINFT